MTTFRSVRMITSTVFLVLLAVPAFAQTQVPTFSKSFQPGVIGAGSSSTLIFTIGNQTGANVSNLAFIDNLPAAIAVATPLRASTTCAGASVAASAGGNSIELVAGSLAAGSTCTVAVDVVSSTVGTHTNVSGNLTSSAGNSGSATADLVVAADRPGFSKSFSPSTISYGSRSTLTFVIDNGANSAVATNLTFSDSLPPGLRVANPANVSSTCSGGALSAPPGATVISFSPNFFGDASVAAQSSCSILVDVTGSAAGQHVNVTSDLTSTGQFGGTARSSGKAGALLTVTIDRLALIKEFVGDPVTQGGTVILRYTVLNRDRESTATSIAFSDDLGGVIPGLVATGLPALGVCGSSSSVTGEGLVALSGGLVEAGGSCTFDVAVAIPEDAPSGGFASTTSSLTAELGGRPVTSAPASDTLFIAPVPRLAKQFVDDPVGAGGTVELEFTITNGSSTAEATGISFEDVLHVILPSASNVPSDGFCGPGSTLTFTPRSQNASATIDVTGASLGAAASCTFSVMLDVANDAPGGIFPNVTSPITAIVGGSTVTGAPASDDLVVVAGPRLRKAFIDDPVAGGEVATLAFTLSHAESAEADALSIAFSDDLDAVITGLSATGLPLTDVCGIGSSLTGGSTITLSNGSLSPGESCSFQVILQVPSGASPGRHTNTTSNVAAQVSGVATVSPAASDDLRIAGLSLTKSFTDDPVAPGGSVTLEYAISNDASLAASGIRFTDDLAAVIPGLVATGLPVNDVCGSGSSLVGVAGNTNLVLQGGSLGGGESCTFSVVLQVPAGTPDNSYRSRTSGFAGVYEGSLIPFENASDLLVVESDFVTLTKEFTNDPVTPGSSVNLRFTLTNLSGTEPLGSLAFSDDVGSLIPGLAATGLPTAACGGTVSGTGVISFSGGSLAAGASCTFDVTLAVPASAPLGAEAINVTSAITGLLGNTPISGEPAVDRLRIAGLAVSKSFSGSATAGGTVVMTISLRNFSSSAGASDLSLTDNLEAMLPGTVAVGLPASDVCGAGSLLSGTSLVTLSSASLLPSGSCSFGVTLQIPGSAAPGSYVNTTSSLRQAGLAAAEPATATLQVTIPSDDDRDGVPNGSDLCPGTVIPESVPTRELRPNHYALIDGDTIFDTIRRNDSDPVLELTTADTRGCSCEQILVAMNLGEGQRKFGCSIGTMLDWMQSLP